MDRPKLFTNLKRNNVLQTLYAWQAPERDWHPKSRDWYVIYTSLFTILISMALILGEFILVFLILAFVFLWFTQASVPPEIVEHKITGLGIKTYSKVYKWKQIKHYWFSRRENTYFLNLDILDLDITKNLDRTQRLSLILNEEDLDDVFYALLNFVDYGDTDEIGFNFVTRHLHGDYIGVDDFFPDDIESQEDYLEMIGENDSQNK